MDFNTCGVPYSTHDDGRVSVQGQFPEYTNEAVRAKIKKIWDEYGATIQDAASKWNLKPAWLVGIIYIESGGNAKAAAACEPKWCPGLWNAGKCAAQGGPEQYCAGGLMAFISATAGMFGKTMTYFIEHPHEMIHAAAELISVGGPKRNAYHGGIQGNGGDVLSVVKMYNGGSKCGGGGLTGHGGQADYVSKFVKVCNTFVAMGLAPRSVWSAPSQAGIDGWVVVGLAVAGFFGAKYLLGRKRRGAFDFTGRMVYP